MKEASSLGRGSKVVSKESLDCSYSKKKADELGLRLNEPFLACRRVVLQFTPLSPSPK